MKTEITTKSGFKCEIDEDALDDAELLDFLSEIDEGNPLYFPRVCAKLLGADGKKALYDHLRTEDGRVPCEALGDGILDIITSLKSKKKS